MAELNKREEEKKKLQEQALMAMKARKEVEEKRQLEQKAMVNVRKAIQKIRVATADTFEAVKAELEASVAQELPIAGSQTERLKEEVQKAIELVQKRLVQAQEQLKKNKELKEELERKLKEQEEKAKEGVKELTVQVDAVEVSLAKLQKLAEPLDDEDGKNDLNERDIEELTRKIEESAEQTRALTKASSEFVLKQGAIMKELPQMGKGAAVAPSEAKQAFAKLLAKLNDAKRATESTVTSAKAGAVNAKLKAVARDDTKAIERLFKKYDRDSDKHLNKKEVLSFAKGEFKLTLPNDVLDRIFDTYVDEGAKGVKLEHFQLCKSAIGVAREMLRDGKRRAEREKNEKALKKLTDSLQEDIKQVMDDVDEADKEVAKAEKHLQPAGTNKSLEMVKLVDEAEELIKEAKTAAADAREKIKGLGEGLEERFEAELKAFLSKDTRQLELRVSKLDSRLSRATQLAARFRDQAKVKLTAETVELKKLALRVIRHNMRLKKQSNEALFKDFDAKKDANIDETKFVRWFSKADKNLTTDAATAGDDEEADVATDGAAAKDGDAKADAATLSEDEIRCVFKSLLPDGAKNLDKEVFMRFIRFYMKVVKETAMTNSMSIKDSTAIGRLEVNDVVEVLQGPLQEETVEVMRVHAKAMKDGTVGWITVAGNQGTLFLKEGGYVFKVAKETQLTDSFEIEDEAKSLRKLTLGEVLEVVEWPAKEPKSGHMRIKAKARKDGKEGWVTTLSNQGTVHLEPV